MLQRKYCALMVLVGMLMALMPTAFASDGGVDETWSSEMNQESYWETRFGPGAECTKYENHNGSIPSKYEAAAVHDGQYVRVYAANPPSQVIGPYNPASQSHHDAPHSWIMKCDIEEQPPQTDYCDPTNKPGGQDIGEWLGSAPEGAPTDCIDIDVEAVCGAVTGEVTRNLTPYTWFISFEEGPVSYSLPENGGLTFDEDYNGGSVEVFFYLSGPEADYAAFADEPNFWQQNASSITVDTDCKPPVTTTTTVPPTTAPTTTVPEPTTTVPATTQPEETTTTEPTRFLCEDGLVVAIGSEHPDYEDASLHAGDPDCAESTTEEDEIEELPFTGPEDNLPFYGGIALGLLGSGAFLLRRSGEFS